MTPRECQEPMPPPGTWIPLASTFIHRCCQCGAAHQWRMRIIGDLIEACITPCEEDPDAQRT